MSEEASRQQAGQIGKLEENLREAWSAKSAVETELRKQKEAEEEAKKSVAEALKAAEESNKAMETWEKSYKDLEAHVDLTKAKIKFAEDRLAKE